MKAFGDWLVVSLVVCFPSVKEAFRAFNQAALLCVAAGTPLALVNQGKAELRSD